MRETLALPAPALVLRVAVSGVLIALAAAAALHFAAGVDALALARLGPPCLVRAVTGVPCPGCGMTRALLLLAELRVGESLAAHPAAPLLLAAMVTVAVRGPVRLPGTQAAASLLLVACLGVWVARLAAG